MCLVSLTHLSERNYLILILNSGLDTLRFPPPPFSSLRHRLIVSRRPKLDNLTGQATVVYTTAHSYLMTRSAPSSLPSEYASGIEMGGRWDAEHPIYPHLKCRPVGPHQRPSYDVAAADTPSITVDGSFFSSFFSFRLRVAVFCLPVRVRGMCECICRRTGLRIKVPAQDRYPTMLICDEA